MNPPRVTLVQFVLENVLFSACDGRFSLQQHRSNAVKEAPEQKNVM